MAPQDEKWTKRGDGQWTDEECEKEEQPKPAPAPGSFGQRLARFPRAVPNAVETPKENGTGEAKEQSGAEHSAAVVVERSAAVQRLRNSFVKGGSESSGTSVFPESPPRKEFPQPITNSRPRNHSGERRCSGKPRGSFQGSVCESQSDIAFPPPPGGFGGARAIRGGGDRNESQDRNGGRSSGWPRSQQASVAVAQQGPVSPAIQSSHMSQQLSPAPQKAPVVQQSPTAQQPILFGIPIVASGGASQLAPLQYVYLMGSAASDMAGIFANSTLDAGLHATSTVAELAQLINRQSVSEQAQPIGITPPPRGVSGVRSGGRRSRGGRGRGGRRRRTGVRRGRGSGQPRAEESSASVGVLSPPSRPQSGPFERKQPQNARQRPAIPRFPPTTKGLGQNVPVRRLTVMGCAVKDEFQISTDITPREGHRTKATLANLAQILRGYYIYEQFELKGIHFEVPVVEALSNLGGTVRVGCELLVHNCDLRALSVDALTKLFAAFASPRIQFRGVVELPGDCQDLLEFRTVKAATCLKFRRSRCGQVSPAVKIDMEKLCQLLFSGAEYPRYVALQHRQVYPTDIKAMINAFRAAVQSSKRNTQFIVDIYTKTVPAEIYGGRTIQEISIESRQRLHIRYDLSNYRIVMRCSTGPNHVAAMNFEQQLRVDVDAVPGRKTRSQAEDDMPKNVDANSNCATNGSANAAGDEVEGDHSVGSCEPNAEHGSSSSVESADDDRKGLFMTRIMEFFENLYQKMDAKGAHDEKQQLKQRLSEMVAEFEQQCNLQ